MIESQVVVVFGTVAWVAEVIQPWVWLATEQWVVVTTGAQVQVLAVIQSWIGLVTEP